MIPAIQDALDAMEVLDAEALQRAFASGIHPDMEWKGTSFGQHLINMYLRGPGFKACAQVIFDHGWSAGDLILKAVLTEDAGLLAEQLAIDSSAIHRTYSFQCTFTPLHNASLLHICAEYNLTQSARTLLGAGMDVNIRAGMDEHGFGGQTPIFHTVNQHNNACLPMMILLMEHQADLLLTLPGLIWGKGYEWETFIPSVNPISYAMMGLLRQFQRKEEQVYEVVERLMKAAFGISYRPGNIPNRYLT